jgi:hypothetical protein
MWSGGWAPTGSGPPSGRYRPAGSGELARAKDLDQQALVILERRLVMVEFPSADHARRWYASEDYVAAIPPSRCDLGAWSYGAAFVLTCGGNEAWILDGHACGEAATATVRFRTFLHPWAFHAACSTMHGPDA